MTCYPPNFLEALLEASNFLDSASKNSTSKEEICLSMERRLSLLIGKAVSAPTGSSFAIFNQDTKKTEPQELASCAPTPTAARTTGTAGQNNHSGIAASPRRGCGRVLVQFDTRRDALPQ